MQSELDVVSFPFGPLNAFFDEVNGLDWLVFESATSELWLLIDSARIEILLPSDEITADSDLRTSALKFLSLVLVKHKGLCQKRVCNLGAHVLQVDEDG